MKILIFGSSGQLGKALARELKKYNLILIDKTKCDLRNLNCIKQIINDSKPKLIINAAAFTNVDMAERKKREAFKINCDAPRVMAQKSYKLDIPFIHFSTDFVFSGNKNKYTEKSKKNPLNYYGYSKSKGEDKIKEVGGKYFIFRTSWVYSKIRNNFFLTIKERIKSKKKLYVVNDQKSVPTPSYFLAKKIKEIIPHIFDADKSGIFHLTPNGSCSKFKFAKLIAKKVNSNFNPKNIIPISSKKFFKSSAIRPNKSILENIKFKKVFGLQIKNWKYYFNKYF